MNERTIGTVAIWRVERTVRSKAGALYERTVVRWVVGSEEFKTRRAAVKFASTQLELFR